MFKESKIMCFVATAKIAILFFQLIVEESRVLMDEMKNKGKKLPRN